MKKQTTLVLTTLLFFLGCQGSTNVRIGKLRAPTKPVETSIFLLSKAVDARKKPSDKVGRHLISLLMIPGPSVVTDGPHLDEAVAGHAKTALETSGYTVTLVDKIEDAMGPVLVTQIDDIRNYNFTWLWPIGILWGKMDMTVLLMSPQEDILWEAQTKGHGGYWGSILYMAGFGTRVKSDLTANLNQVIEITSSDEFKYELQKAKESL